MTDQRVNLKTLSDDELLFEIHRRFGDSWCAFSAGVRSLDECPACKKNQPLTRHHLVPIATGAGHDREVKRRYVKICSSCHTLAHTKWGPGDDWSGPTDREIFLRDLIQILKAE